MAKKKKIENMSYESIRSSLPSSWDGMVDSIVSNSVGYNAKIPSAQSVKSPGSGSGLSLIHI